MIISIFASIGSGNLGDELILKNEIKILEQKYIKNSPVFKVFTYDINDTFYKCDNIEYIEYFPVGIRNLKNIFRNFKNFTSFFSIVKKSDLIVVGGGGIFFDTEIGGVTNPLKLWYLRSIFFRLFSKKVLYNAIGIDIKDNNNFKIIRKIFSGNIEITVRDKNTFDLLNKNKIESKIVKDPVFYDNNLDDNINLLDSLIGSVNISGNILESFKEIDNITFKGKVFGIGFRSGYIKNELEVIEQLIEYIILNGGKIVLLPHSFHSEHIESNDFFFLKYFSDKFNLDITKTIEETYLAYRGKKIDYCLGMRLHSMILSSVYDIKLISFSYSKKTDMLIKK